ncbi:MAG: hypothetical protein ACK4F9_02955 [Brevinematia bacterium]
MSIKLFELEIIALQASKQLNIAYSTVMKIYDMLQRSIYHEINKKSQDLYGEIE